MLKPESGALTCSQPVGIFFMNATAVVVYISFFFLVKLHLLKVETFVLSIAFVGFRGWWCAEVYCVQRSYAG